MYTLTLFAGIGFLIAVLWIDLIFDSSAWLYRGGNEDLPEEVLATMSHYYRRVTHKPYMLFLIMAIILGMLILQITQNLVPAWIGWLSLILFLISAGCAGVYVIPIASRLRSRTDQIEKQSQLARSLFPAHVFCFILILLLGAIQFYAAS